MTRNTFTPLRTRFLAGFPFLVLTLLLLLFFYDIVFFGKTLSTSAFLPGTSPQGPYGFSGQKPAMPFSFDTPGNAWVNEPNPYIIRKVLEGGSLPTWTPYEGLGMPLLANMNSELLNPLKLFLNLFPHPFAQDIFFLLRLLVAGLFTCLFLREMKLSLASSLLGGSFFMLSGYSVWWINLHPLSTVMYLPAVFYFYEHGSERKDAKSLFFMSLCLCLSLTGGKIPDVIMGLSLLFLYGISKGALRDSFRGMLGEAGWIIAGTVSGMLMASAVLFPFLELYGHASPLAKAIRTGSASHTIPLLSSVSLLQPLFLGWGNYFYGSWLKWTPDAILPHAGIVVTVLALYAALQRDVLKKTFPFLFFSLILVCIICGVLPSHLISRLPVIGSIGFLKYNAMLYFSLAVMAGAAFDHLLSEEVERKKLFFSLTLVGLLLLAYFFLLYGRSPLPMRTYLIVVLASSLSGILLIGLVFHFPGRSGLFGTFVAAFLMLELFLYMPGQHPDRVDPYREPPYFALIKEPSVFRIAGEGNVIPPLVSNAMGLYDIRAISVLLPGHYYLFFENLLSFSMPQTNNPGPLFFATSPFIDLAGVKYFMTREPLEQQRLPEAIGTHIASVRLIRLFGAMIRHTVEGGMTYGSIDQGGESRISLVFPMKFAFRTKLMVSEPYLFVGFGLADVPKGTSAKIKITVEDSTAEVTAKGGEWSDRWLDLSRFAGQVITVRIEGDSGEGGKVVLGNFGLSPGAEKERSMYDRLLAQHAKEFSSLEYRGASEGIHVYENRNVMARAFVVHGAKTAGSPEQAIRELEEGVNFREIALVASPVPGLNDSPAAVSGVGEQAVIKKYLPDEVAIEVNSEGGLLVLSDLYYPGWKARVNGRDEPVVRSFGVLRGVPVGKGRSEVLFSYRPMSLYAGIAVSVIMFVIWITILIVSRKKTGAAYLRR
jgi:hypothetical protein